MSRLRKESFFWTSYSDLMTTLFFVMLVLFVLVIVLLHNKMVEIEKEKQATEQRLVKIQKLEEARNATEQQYAKIREIEESIKNIDKDYFEYNADFKRHTLKDIDVSFIAKSSNIYDIPDYQLERLLEAGHSIKNFVNEAVEKNPEVKYLLIIEGQASKDTYVHNFELSYERALALVKYWKSKGLNFNAANCEVIISGSGIESPFRVINNEAANQRFVIHIIPKIGEIKNN